MDRIEELSQKMVNKNIPFSAYFELTWRCNQKCIHCYQFRPSADELTTVEVKGIMSQLARMSCLHLAFTGGEPLLRQDFWEIAKYAREKTFDISLLTNGTLVTPRIVDKIHELNFGLVDISLLGASASTHDKITRNYGSFDKVVSAVKLLKRRGIKLRLKCTLMEENFPELEKIQNLADGLEVSVHISPLISPKNTGSKEPLKYSLTEKHLKEFYSFLFRNAPKLDFTQAYTAEGNMLLCNMGRTTCCINPLGDLYPCVGAPLVAGNLKKKSFQEIWDSSELLHQLRLMRNSDLKICSRCNLAAICFRCTAIASLEHGDLFGPSLEACRHTKIVKEVRT